MIKIAARFNFTIPDDLLVRVKTLAKEMNLSTSELLNRIIYSYIQGDRLTHLEERVAKIEEVVFSKAEKQRDGFDCMMDAIGWKKTDGKYPWEK